MITLNQACRIAYDFFANQNYYGLKTITDLGDRWVFFGYAKVIPYGGLIPISVWKKTGEVSDFEFWLSKSWEELKKGIRIEVPDGFKPDIND